MLHLDREPHLLAFRDHALATTPAGDPVLPRPAFRDDTILDRLARLRDDPRALAVALAAVALAAGVLFYRSAMAQSPDVPVPPPATGASSTTTATGELVVHVSGAVAAPGVYRLAPGARTADAVAAAGGAVEGAEPDRLNLAAHLGDGQRVHVPKAGEPLPAGASGDAPGGIDGAGPINVNGATAEQLEALPGVGPSLAAAIISERERRGGFRSVDDLLSVRGIGEKRLADLRPLVVV